MQPTPTTSACPATIAEHIEITPGICGGKPRIAGHRIKVQHIVIWHEHQGMTPGEIVLQHPGLTLADVHAALAYYHDHRKQIDDDIHEGFQFAEKLRAGGPSVFEKVRKTDATDDPLPPG